MALVSYASNMNSLSSYLPSQPTSLVIRVLQFKLVVRVVSSKSYMSVLGAHYHTMNYIRVIVPRVLSSQMCQGRVTIGTGTEI